MSLLRADGYLVFTFHLFRGSEIANFFGARPNDRVDLTLVAIRLQQEVERTRADRVICTNEMWLGRAMYGHPEDDPDRKEAVSTMAVQADGFTLALTTPFSRGPLGIEFLETTEDTATVHPFLAQLVTYWRTIAR
jgi:hypothetical protein